MGGVKTSAGASDVHCAGTPRVCPSPLCRRLPPGSLVRNLRGGVHNGATVPWSRALTPGVRDVQKSVTPGVRDVQERV